MPLHTRVPGSAEALGAVPHLPETLGDAVSPTGNSCNGLPSASEVQAFVRSLGPRPAHWQAFDPEVHPLGEGWGHQFSDRGYLNGCLSLLYSEVSSPTNGLLGFVGGELMVNFDFGEPSLTSAIDWLRRALIRAWSRYDSNSGQFSTAQVSEAKYEPVNHLVENIQDAIDSYSTNCDLFTDTEISARYSQVCENRPFNPILSDNLGIGDTHPLLRLIWYDGPVQRLIRALMFLPDALPRNPSFAWPPNWWTVNYPAEIASFECTVPTTLVRSLPNTSVPMVALTESLRRQLQDASRSLRTRSEEIAQGQRTRTALTGLGLGFLVLPLELFAIEGAADEAQRLLEDLADWLELAADPDAALNDSLAFLGVGLDQALARMGGQPTGRDLLERLGEPIFGDLNATERAALCLSLNTRGPAERRMMKGNLAPEHVRAFNLRLDEIVMDPLSEDVRPIFVVPAQSWRFRDFERWDADFVDSRLSPFVPDPNGQRGEYLSIRNWLLVVGPTIQLADCLENARTLLRVGLQADSLAFAADPLMTGAGSIGETARAALSGIGWDCLRDITHGHGIGLLVTGVWRQLIADMFYGVVLARARPEERADLQRCLDEIFCWMLPEGARADIDAVLGPPVEDFDWLGADNTDPPAWRRFQDGLLSRLVGEAANVNILLCRRWDRLSCEERELMQRFADRMADTCAATLLDSQWVGPAEGGFTPDDILDGMADLHWSIPTYAQTDWWQPDFGDSWWIRGGIDVPTPPSGRFRAEPPFIHRRISPQHHWQEVSFGWEPT